jgi:glycosyltransferase involved in cell wall biosynthesis
MKFKVLFVLEHFYPYIGGVETLFLSLTTALVGQGNEVKVITTKHDSSLPTYELINGVEVERIKVYNRFLFTFLGIFRIYKNCDKYDIIHTTTYNAALPAYICAKLRSKKIVVTWHEHWGKLWFKLPYLNSIEKYGYYLYERLIYKLNYNKIIAVSEFTKETLLEGGKPNDNVITIYNGLDYKRIEETNYNKSKSLHSSDRYVIFVARLGVSKGIDLLLESLPKMLSSYPDLKLKFVIPTVPAKLYKKIIQIINLLERKENIELYHNLEKEVLLSLISNAEFIIIPSYSEGFCFVAAEAVALNVPIVHSGKGALGEVVSGRNINYGSIVSNSLYNGLLLGIENKFDYKEKKLFHLSDSIEKYMDVYRRL